MALTSSFADMSRGVVYIHSSPAAICPHIEWVLSATLNSPPNLAWSPQPVAPELMRTVTEWAGPAGTASQLVRGLRAWPMLRFEVTEDPSEGVDGQRFSYTPSLGLWNGTMSANGDVMIGEMRLRAMLTSGVSGVLAELDTALGAAWDEELESYRQGREDASKIWLHRNTG